MVDVIDTVISGVIAGGISAAILVWKMRSQDTQRKIEAHTRLLRVLEEAHKNAADKGYGRTNYPHWFTTSSRELFATCMTDPLISDAVHGAYKASGRILVSSPGENQPVIYIANFTKLQAAVKEELSNLKRKGRWRFLMCRGNPARQSGGAS